MIKAILFDIDGVLLDSLHANAQHYRDLFAHFGYQGPTDEELAKVHHLTAIACIRHFLPDVKESTINEMFEYMKSLPQREELFRIPDDAVDTVRLLSEMYRLGAVSSRTRAAMETLLAFLDVRPLFTALVGFEDTATHKPDPEPLLHACRILAVAPHETIYVGDMPADVDAARAAGMKMIHYSAGALPGDHLTVSNFAQLPEILVKLSNP